MGHIRSVSWAVVVEALCVSTAGGLTGQAVSESYQLVSLPQTVAYGGLLSASLFYTMPLNTRLFSGVCYANGHSVGKISGNSYQPLGLE